METTKTNWNVSLKGDSLKNVRTNLKNIKSLITEGMFKFDNEGLKMTAMDAANVAMVIFFVPAKDFDLYNISEEVNLGLNVDIFYKSLTAFKESVTISMDDDGRLKTHDAKYSFTVPLIELDNQQRNMPALEFNATITPDSKLADFISNLIDISEGINFEVRNKKFILSAQGDLRKGEAVVCDVNAPDTSSKFSSEYLTKFFAFGKPNKIELGNEYPLRVTFDNVIAILAPRVQND